MDMITNEDHSKHADCAWPDEPCNQLTFVEAMALDPSEVEVEHRGEWVPLERPNHPSGEFLLSFLRKAKLRRRLRPKRSRVQEMASDGDFAGMRASLYAEAVRAVCKWLGTESGQSEARVDKSFGGFLAKAIEREFLEPR